MKSPSTRSPLLLSDLITAGLLPLAAVLGVLLNHLGLASAGIMASFGLGVGFLSKGTPTSRPEVHRGSAAASDVLIRLVASVAALGFLLSQNEPLDPVLPRALVDGGAFCVGTFLGGLFRFRLAGARGPVMPLSSGALRLRRTLWNLGIATVLASLLLMSCERIPAPPLDTNDPSELRSQGEECEQDSDCGPDLSCRVVDEAVTDLGDWLDLSCGGGAGAYPWWHHPRCWPRDHLGALCEIEDDCPSSLSCVATIQHANRCLPLGTHGDVCCTFLTNPFGQSLFPGGDDTCGADLTCREGYCDLD